MTLVLCDGPRAMVCCVRRRGCLCVPMKGEDRDMGSDKGTVHSDSCKDTDDFCFPCCDQRKTVNA